MRERRRLFHIFPQARLWTSSNSDSKTFNTFNHGIPVCHEERPSHQRSLWLAGRGEGQCSIPPIGKQDRNYRSSPRRDPKPVLPGNIFFVDYLRASQSHPNTAIGIRSVWLMVKCMQEATHTFERLGFSVGRQIHAPRFGAVAQEATLRKASLMLMMSKRNTQTQRSRAYSRERYRLLEYHGAGFGRDSRCHEGSQRSNPRGLQGHLRQQRLDSS